MGFSWQEYWSGCPFPSPGDLSDPGLNPHHLQIHLGLGSVQLSHSVVSDSLRPHGLQPTELLCPWDFPGKNTGVGCYFLLQGDIPNPRIKPKSPVSPALAGGFFTTEPLGEPFHT